MKKAIYISLLFLVCNAVTANAQCWWLQNIDAPSFELEDIFFIDAQRGWAVGSNSSIWRTVNGGATWQKKDSGLGYLTRFHSVHFVDSLTGYIAVGIGNVIKTTNGGETWFEKTKPSTGFLSGIYFINSQTGWAVGTGWEFYKTTDGGDHWTAQNLGFLGYDKVLFLDNQNGWISSGTNMLHTETEEITGRNSIYIIL